MAVKVKFCFKIRLLAGHLLRSLSKLPSPIDQILYYSVSVPHLSGMIYCFLWSQARNYLDHLQTVPLMSLASLAEPHPPPSAVSSAGYFIGPDRLRPHYCFITCWADWKKIHYSYLDHLSQKISPLRGPHRVGSWSTAIGFERPFLFAGSQSFAVLPIQISCLGIWGTYRRSGRSRSW